MAKLVTPQPPAYLPKKKQEEWLKTFENAAAVAAKDTDDPGTIRQIALKRANELLRVSAPKSAADIEKMDAHEFIHRGSRVIDGVEHATVVTADGGKYAFPKEKPKTNAQASA